MIKYLACIGLLGVMGTARADLNAAPASPAGSGAPGVQESLEKIEADLNALHAAAHADEATNQRLIIQVQAETKNFAATFPNDAHALPVAMLYVQMSEAMMAKQLPGAPTGAEMAQTLESLAANPRVPPADRARLRLMEMSNDLQAALRSPADPAAWAAMETRIAAFEKDFGPGFSLDGTTPVIVMVRSQELDLAASLPDQTEFNALLKTLSASSNPKLVALAQAASVKQTYLLDLKSRPLDLKFTSLDGKAIDLAQMRGKIVLVDFWATWCAPCLAQVPELVSVYQRYHAQGFEIVGISLDQEKDAVTSYTSEHGMAWPQSWDGKGWDTPMAKTYSLHEIPALWLVGKDGKLITTNAGENLGSQVAAALAVP